MAIISSAPEAHFTLRIIDEGLVAVSLCNSGK
jgi:hypothetical protein